MDTKQIARDLIAVMDAKYRRIDPAFTVNLEFGTKSVEIREQLESALRHCPNGGTFRLVSLAWPQSNSEAVDAELEALLDPTTYWVVEDRSDPLYDATLSALVLTPAPH